MIDSGEGLPLRIVLTFGSCRLRVGFALAVADPPDEKPAEKYDQDADSGYGDIENVKHAQQMLEDSTSVDFQGEVPQ